VDFTSAIISWYKINKRDLPWRKTKDPYFIWLSEVILQQTRVEQGVNYYLSFVREFPDIKKLAVAPENKIMKLWQGLGYYTRARNLHSTAKHIATEFNGKFPDTYLKLIELKGIGPYTAAAIASIAYNQPHAAVDGNVYRVLARVFGLHTAIDSISGKKEFSMLANELIDKNKPDLYNQAVMEFGATFCKPKKPDCVHCIFSKSCIAYNKKMVALLPFKEKKTKIRKRFFNYIVIKHGETVIIKKRSGKDIWKNLYDFPLIETDKELEAPELLRTKEWKELLSKGTYNIHTVSTLYKHVLTHQHIFARFWEIQTTKQWRVLKGQLKIKQNEFYSYPVPRLIDLYMENSDTGSDS
jgi:A/G-specific adenine glycosylase